MVLRLFLPTALFGQIAMGVIGLYVWISLWGVIDVLLHRFAMDYAYRTFAEVRNLGLGSAAIQTFSTSSLKTLSNFATMRWLAGGIAAAVGGMIGFKGAAALTSVANRMTSTQESAAQRAGAMASPEGRAQMLTSQEMAGATLGNHPEFGAGAYMDRMLAKQRADMREFGMTRGHFGSTEAMTDAQAHAGTARSMASIEDARITGVEGAMEIAGRGASRRLDHAIGTTNEDMSKLGALDAARDRITADKITPDMQAEMTEARLGAEYGAAIKQGNFEQAAELASKKMTADVERFGHLSEGELRQLGALQASADSARAKHGDTSKEYHAAAVKLEQAYGAAGVYSSPRAAGAVAGTREQQSIADTMATDKFWRGDYGSMGEAKLIDHVSKNAGYLIGQGDARLGASMRTSEGAERAGLVASGKAIGDFVQRSGMTYDSSTGVLRIEAKQDTGIIGTVLGTKLSGAGAATIDIGSKDSKNIDLNTAMSTAVWNAVNKEASQHAGGAEWANQEYARRMNMMVGRAQGEAASTQDNPMQSNQPSGAHYGATGPARAAIGAAGDIAQSVMDANKHPLERK
ncbi:MAG: conjugal transfer protein TraG N-terminal domain-containing protein [Nitrospinae bacterium]|nr:conjugal transfer protein TraG N-terminal domain-containing protein [Nitrospinota bacterium]